MHGFDGQPDANDGSGTKTSSSSSAAASASSRGSGGGMLIFQEQLQNGWQDASYSASVDWAAGRFGVSGGNAVCAEVWGGGALAGGLAAHALPVFQQPACRDASSTHSFDRTRLGWMPVQ